MIKKICLCLFLFCGLTSAGLAGTFFRDVPTDHPAYNSVYNLALVYKIISTKEAYFHGDEDITRLQFAVIMDRTFDYIEERSGRRFTEKTVSLEKYVDVPANQWAYPSVNRVVNGLHVMSRYSDQEFKGNRLLTRYEMLAALGKAMNRIDGSRQFSFEPYYQPTLETTEKNKTISRYEVAIAVDLLIQKASNAMFLSLPSEANKYYSFSDELPLALTIKCGGVQEPASGTDNWQVLGGALDLWSQFSLGRRQLKVSYCLDFETSKILYQSSSTYQVVWESRVLVKALAEVPLSSGLSLLLGPEYLNLSNSFSPSSYCGLALGSRVMLAKFPEILFTYSVPITQPAVVVSKYGAPNGRLFLELAAKIDSLGNNFNAIYSFERLLMGSEQKPRNYNELGARIKF